MPDDRDRHRIIPGPAPTTDDDALAPDVWGFRDTRFTLLPNGSVTLTGGRYALSGQELPDLLPWVERVMSVTLPRTGLQESAYPPVVPAARECRGFLAAARAELGEAHVSSDPLVRLRRGHGQTLEEMYRIKQDGLARVPDVVCFPADENEVAPRIDRGEFQVAFILQPTPIRALAELGKVGEVMPQKSTYFFPKLATGMVINPLR